MRSIRTTAQNKFTVFVTLACMASPVSAQQSPQVVIKPHKPFFVRPYLPTSVPPIRLTNSERLHDLIRGGKLYLTVQDTIAAAIENNLDLEVDRYGPLNADWNLK